MDCVPFWLFTRVCVTSHGVIFSRGGNCTRVCVLAGVGIWRRAPEKTGCLLSWKESLVQHNRSFVLQTEMVNLHQWGRSERPCLWLHGDLVSVNIWQTCFQTFRHFLSVFIYFEERLHSYSLANFEPPPRLSSICLWNVRLNQRRLVQTGRRARQKIPGLTALACHSDLFIYRRSTFIIYTQKCKYPLSAAVWEVLGQGHCRGMPQECSSNRSWWCLRCLGAHYPPREVPLDFCIFKQLIVAVNTQKKA